MNGRDVVRCAIFSLAVITLPTQLWSAGRCAAQVPGKTENLDVTPSLVREIQFMLLRLGMEPGPIDGVIGPQTTAAWRKFQQDTGLPPLDLVNGSKILSSNNLKHFSDLLPEDIFCRIHHSHLVNLDHAVHYSKGRGGVLIMANNMTLEVSQRKKDELLGRFKK